AMPHAARHYAARFAAKESVSKAFGTGIGKHMGWRDIEVCRKDSGEPFIVLHGAARDFAEKLNVADPLVSLSHSDNYSVANAIVWPPRLRAFCTWVTLRHFGWRKSAPKATAANSCRAFWRNP